MVRRAIAGRSTDPGIRLTLVEVLLPLERRAEAERHLREVTRRLEALANPDRMLQDRHDAVARKLAAIHAATES